MEEESRLWRPHAESRRDVGTCSEGKQFDRSVCILEHESLRNRDDFRVETLRCQAIGRHGWAIERPFQEIGHLGRSIDGGTRGGEGAGPTGMVVVRVSQRDGADGLVRPLFVKEVDETF